MLAVIVCIWWSFYVCLVSKGYQVSSSQERHTWLPITPNILKLDRLINFGTDLTSTTLCFGKSQHRHNLTHQHIMMHLSFREVTNNVNPTMARVQIKVSKMGCFRKGVAVYAGLHQQRPLPCSCFSHKEQVNNEKLSPVTEHDRWCGQKTQSTALLTF